MEIHPPTRTHKYNNNTTPSLQFDVAFTHDAFVPPHS